MRTPEQITIELDTEKDDTLFSALMHAVMTSNEKVCRGFAPGSMFFRSWSIWPVEDRLRARVTLEPKTEAAILRSDSEEIVFAEIYATSTWPDFEAWAEVR